MLGNSQQRSRQAQASIRHASKSPTTIKTRSSGDTLREKIPNNGQNKLKRVYVTRAIFLQRSEKGLRKLQTAASANAPPTRRQRAANAMTSVLAMLSVCLVPVCLATPTSLRLLHGPQAVNALYRGCVGRRQQPPRLHMLVLEHVQQPACFKGMCFVG